MQKPFEKRTKAKQSYWFLTNETAYLNGQQPDGRRYCGGCGRHRGSCEGWEILKIIDFSRVLRVVRCGEKQ